MKLSVIIICALNESEALRKSLDNIISQEKFSDYEVIVVCDGIDNEITKTINEYSQKIQITYSQRENDLSPGKSRNIGVELSKSEYIISLDSDVLLNKNGLNLFYNFLSSNPNHIVIGKYEKEIQEQNRTFTPFFYYKDLENYINSNKYNIPFYNPGFFTFLGSIGFSKKNYIESGKIDESFKGYGYEDSEFGYRLFKKGYKFSFNNDISSLHYERIKMNEFYNKKMILKNLVKFRNIIFDDIKEFFETDENKIIKNFNKIIPYYSKDQVYSDLVRYYLFKGNEKEASKYSNDSEIKRTALYWNAYKKGLLNWKSFFYNKKLDNLITEKEVYNLIYLFTFR